MVQISNDIKNLAAWPFENQPKLSDLEYSVWTSEGFRLPSWILNGQFLDLHYTTELTVTVTCQADFVDWLFHFFFLFFTLVSRFGIFCCVIGTGLNRFFRFLSRFGLLLHLQLFLQETNSGWNCKSEWRGIRCRVELENVKNWFVFEEEYGFQVGLEGALGRLLELNVARQVRLDLPLDADDFLRIRSGTKINCFWSWLRSRSLKQIPQVFKWCKQIQMVNFQS